MNCDCPICAGRDFNEAGVTIAENEVLPFVKSDILNLRYPRHPLPRKYNGWTASLMAYSQAIASTRIYRAHAEKHNIAVGDPQQYFTGGFWMLKYKNALNNRFPEVVITDINELKPGTPVREVCEYNAEELKNERSNCNGQSKAQ